MRHSFLLYNHTTCVVFQIDFASRDCQIAFFESMEMTGQLRPGDRPEEISSRGIVGGQSFSVDRCVVHVCSPVLLCFMVKKSYLPLMLNTSGQ